MVVDGVGENDNDGVGSERKSEDSVKGGGGNRFGFWWTNGGDTMVVMW